MKQYVIRIGDYWGAGNNSGWAECLQYTCFAKSAQEAGNKAVELAKEKNIDEPVIMNIKLINFNICEETENGRK